MLAQFYAPVGAHRGMNDRHWTVRDIDAGFAAIGQCTACLGGTPVVTRVPLAVGAGALAETWLATFWESSTRADWIAAFGANPGDGGGR